MAIILDEKFEGTGYQDTWTEAVAGGNTVDEDASPADVGKPVRWGGSCLKIVCSDVTSNGYTSNSNFGSQATTYLRFEVILTAESLADNEFGLLAVAQDSVTPRVAYSIYFIQLAGSLYIGTTIRWDDTDNNTYVHGPINLNQKYLIEFEWDYSTRWAWKVDGVEQDNGTFSGAPAAVIDNIILGNLASFSTNTYTCYVDNVAIDDADWVGSVGSITQYTPFGLPGVARVFVAKAAAGTAPADQITVYTVWGLPGQLRTFNDKTEAEVEVTRKHGGAGIRRRRRNYFLRRV